MYLADSVFHTSEPSQRMLIKLFPPNKFFFKGGLASLNTLKSMLNHMTFGSIKAS